MSDLYLECNAGISGDMAVAALLDAGADEAALKAALDSVPAEGFSYKISRVTKSGLEACDFNVILDAAHENHDHDMEYLFGHEHSSAEHGEHTHSPHDHEHHHHHEHEHSSHEHHHEHRNLDDVLKIVDGTSMTNSARRLAHKIFEIIALAESKAHAKPISEVHFHEVGAIDSIVDVIALAVCFDSLAPKRVFVPYLCEGAGTIRCQHGILPIPVPAVANIAAEYSLPLKIIGDSGEFVTPTGAAFVAAVMTDKVLPKEFCIKKIGMGAGKRTYSRPSLVRAFIIEETEQNTDEAKICKLEANIDDCTGEALGFVMEELFAAGARDVHFVPCFMKKNRPAYILTVLCMEEVRAELEKLIFTHTTTIGIRRSYMNRTVLPRKSHILKTEYGEVRIKETDFNETVKFTPEYESIAELCRKTKKPFSELYQEAVNLCKKQFL